MRWVSAIRSSVCSTRPLTYPDQLSRESLAHLAPGSLKSWTLPRPLHVVVANDSIGRQGAGPVDAGPHDMSFVHQRSTDTKRYIFICSSVSRVISAVTVLVAQLSWRGWVAGVRAMLTSKGLPAESSQAHSAELHPVRRIPPRW